MAVHIRIDRDRIEAFCKKWKVREFSIFGSALRDDFGPESDVDILLDLKPRHGLSLFDWVDMIDELKEIFGRDVDLVSKEGLKNPFRKKAILESAVTVCELP